MATDYGDDNDVSDAWFDGETVPGDTVSTRRNTNLKTRATNYLNGPQVFNTTTSLADPGGDIKEAWLYLYKEGLRGRRMRLDDNWIADLRVSHGVSSIFQQDPEDGTYETTGKTILP